MVEIIAISQDDYRIYGLSSKLAMTAPYGTNRRSCTFRRQGSNIYTPTHETKLIKLLSSFHT